MQKGPAVQHTGYFQLCLAPGGAESALKVQFDVELVPCVGQLVQRETGRLRKVLGQFRGERGRKVP